MARSKPSLLSALAEGLPEGGRYLLAVSGGVDSVSLLHAALSLASIHHWKIEVAHVNHGLRDTAERDECFVRRLAESANVPFHLHRASPPTNENIEAWGRRIRYRFFREIVRERGLSAAVTAHTADDVAETLLMKLVSNKELTTIAEESLELAVVRPTVSIPKSAMVSYAAENGLSFMEDETNSDPRFLRNRVRAALIPLLARDFDPRIVETLAERARSADEDIATLYGLVEEAARAIASRAHGSQEWLRALRAELTRLPSALQWRLVERMYHPLVGYQLGRRQARKVLEFTQGEAVGVEIAGGIALRKHAGGVTARRRAGPDDE
jgi:tRNA(Ile)-lysidine synthase